MARISLTLARYARKSGDTISAAADGVGARRSATRSAMVWSVSWPTAETTGMLEAKMARATRSSLNALSSVRDPPPRATMMTSTLPCSSSHSLSRRSAATISSGARSPWTELGARTTSARGYRRVKMVMMSWSTAPPSEVTTPMRRGKRGSGRLRSGANSPSRSRRSFRASI